MIALVGDHSLDVPAHRAIPIALEIACKHTGCRVEWRWFGTETVREARRDLSDCSAVWLVPASPYRNMNGALDAVRFARETKRPFLGTCGGFQHAVIEIARDVAGLTDAAHAETNPDGRTLVVTQLSCPLLGKSDEITFTPGSRMHAIFGGRPARGEFHCCFGVNAAFRPALEAAGVRFTGFDVAGDIRAMELPEHPFFCGTLFQPERSALRGDERFAEGKSAVRHPLIEAFVRAAAATH